jgi:hypothetical protein
MQEHYVPSLNSTVGDDGRLTNYNIGSATGDFSSYSKPMNKLNICVALLGYKYQRKQRDAQNFEN